jgi:hypothetical protein
MRVAPITLTLLDPARGHALHAWTFDGHAIIRIGRGDGNDVVIADPVVSRRHVELVPGDGEWQIVSLGRHGTWLNGAPISGTQPIWHATVLQLGGNGPALEFRLDPAGGEAGETMTGLPASALALPTLDREALRADVGRIAEGEQFRQLQERADAFKRAREARRSAGRTS